MNSADDAFLSLKDSALPKGFSLYGVRGGISSIPGKKDTALFLSHRPARAAGVFTRNRVKAAPVVLSQKQLKSSATFQAVLINSGCANACTGKQGVDDALWSLDSLSEKIKIPSSQFLVASTGVIGRSLPRPAMEKGLEGLARAVRAEKSSTADAVVAIMTTDTRPKAAQARFSWKGKSFVVWGCAKGAGMIHPNMATMLSVVLTDAGLPASVLRSALRWAAGKTFNRVSVDGDTSTNDSLFILANGAAGPLSSSGKAFSSFRAALHQVCLSLSVQIAADGEGATRTAWIFVQGASSEKSAHLLASAVATSPLVKTALHGADPNWGRILAALGRAGVPFDPDKVEMAFGELTVCKNGRGVDFSEKEAHRLLKRPRVTVTIDLHQGKAWSHYVTCDFSKDYVAVNADYTT